MGTLTTEEPAVIRKRQLARIPQLTERLYEIFPDSDVIVVEFHPLGAEDFPGHEGVFKFVISEAGVSHSYCEDGREYGSEILGSVVGQHLETFDLSHVNPWKNS